MTKHKKLWFFWSIMSLCGSLFMATGTLMAAEDDDNASTQDAKPALLSPQQERIAALIRTMSINRSHEVETVESPNGNFTALFRESSTGDPQGCIILIHGDNEHPDWPQVIAPIRDKLTQNSWCTLSIEIPDTTKRHGLPNLTAAIVDEEKTLPNEEEVFVRIDSARQHLQEKGYSRMVFLGHGTGAAYGLKYVVRRGITGSALVLIEPITPAPLSDFDLAQFVEAVRLPTLDYYFASSSSKQAFAQYRQAAANKRGATNNAYVQFKASPDRRYDPAGNKRLTQRVWGFLKQNTNQMQQTRPLPLIDKGLFHKSLNK